MRDLISILAGKHNIAFIGEISCGKTFFAQHWESAFGFKTFSFARKLKVLASTLTPDGVLDKSRDRPLLQDLGNFLKIPLWELSTHQAETLRSEFDFKIVRIIVPEHIRFERILQIYGKVVENIDFPVFDLKQLMDISETEGNSILADLDLNFRDLPIKRQSRINKDILSIH